MSQIAPHTPKTTPLRPAEVVMRLHRLGSFHQCRLSFMRILLRRMKAENWRFERPVFALNERSVGHAVYTAHGPERSYSLVAFAHDLPDDARTDRVIAEAWDTTFTLFDGVPTNADIDRLRDNVPLQEAGRISASELTLSRANRSNRMWDYIVSTLAGGQQPDKARLDDVGYIMRTTAVYGSGKFGASDRVNIADRSELSPPFQAEMLTVYLIRSFVRDLVNHAAQCQGAETAVALDGDLARDLGIGNSTGLGMAPFLINHPELFNNWIMARETALARVRALEQAKSSEARAFLMAFDRARASVDLWRSEHPIQTERLTDLRNDMNLLSQHLKEADLTTQQPWDRLYVWAEDRLSDEGQEFLASLLLEPYGDLVDDLSATMSAPTEHPPLDGSMQLTKLQKLIEQLYPWALSVDWTAKTTNARAWYVSAEKLEPRLGERFEEPIEPYEQPLAPGRDITRLYADLKNWDGADQVAHFAMVHPEHRHVLERVQRMAHLPYGEIRDNTIDAEMKPIDMLRCKLSFFGAQHFDPRSDRWVRICMFRGAPMPEELTQLDADMWCYPNSE